METVPDTAASVVSHHTDATPECIYLDYNATTPIFPEVSEAMVPYITSRFGNPSSLHTLGQTSEGAVRVAREQIAHLIGAEASEIYFTSCGTESNNWAIWGAVMQRRAHQPQGPPPHVVTTAVEHPAVLKPLESWAGLGLLRYSVVGVDAEGRVDPDAVAAAMDPEGGTCLVSVMHSNNEVGTLQPIAEVSRQAKAYGALMHTDAAQSVGKLGVDVRKLGVDLLTLVGHKFGAPKGVAALFVRKGVGPLPSLLHGGGQEAGARSGTENVPHIVALGAAAVVAATELPVVAQKMARQRSLLLQLIAEGVGVGGGGGGGGEDAAAAVKVHGPADAQLRLPNTLSVCCPGTSAAAVLQQLAAQVAMSAGSACHSGDPGRTRPSPVLSAMGVAESDAAATLRLSVGRGTTDLEIHRAAALISAALRAHLMLSRG